MRNQRPVLLGLRVRREVGRAAGGYDVEGHVLERGDDETLGDMQERCCRGCGGAGRDAGISKAGGKGGGWATERSTGRAGLESGEVTSLGWLSAVRCSGRASHV